MNSPIISEKDPRVKSLVYIYYLSFFAAMMLTDIFVVSWSVFFFSLILSPFLAFWIIRMFERKPEEYLHMIEDNSSYKAQIVSLVTRAVKRGAMFAVTFEFIKWSVRLIFF